MPLCRVGLLYYPTLADSLSLASQIESALKAADVDVWSAKCDDLPGIVADMGDLEMLITLGGDGTIVRTARLAAPYGIPVLGVNLGRLGFLAEMEPSEVMAQMPRLCRGDYWLEKRLMLRAEHWRGDRLLSQYDALNDAFVGRGLAARVLRVTVRVDGARITTYVADGIIAATPTGSTAYSLSAGGPIAAPGIDNLVLTPVAPHLTPARSLVLPSGCTITMSISSQSAGILTVDGHIDGHLEDDDRVVIRKSPHIAQFVRLGPANYFYETLIQRLNRRTDESEQG